MTTESRAVYPLGDILALARQSWIGELANRLDALGYPGYRRSDSAAMRLLMPAPLPVGRLGTAMGVTRQAAKKVADGLQRRGYASTGRDARDTRQVNVTLTAAGRAYAQAIRSVIEQLNREVAGRVQADDLVAADAVLRAVLFDQSARQRAERLPRPAGRPS